MSLGTELLPCAVGLALSGPGLAPWGSFWTERSGSRRGPGTRSRRATCARASDVSPEGWAAWHRRPGPVCPV